MATRRSVTISENDEDDDVEGGGGGGNFVGGGGGDDGGDGFDANAHESEDPYGDGDGNGDGDEETLANAYPTCDDEEGAAGGDGGADAAHDEFDEETGYDGDHPERSYQTDADGFLLHPTVDDSGNGARDDVGDSNDDGVFETAAPTPMSAPHGLCERHCQPGSLSLVHARARSVRRDPKRCAACWTESVDGAKSASTPIGIVVDRALHYICAGVVQVMYTVRCRIDGHEWQAARETVCAARVCPVCEIRGWHENGTYPESIVRPPPSHTKTSTSAPASRLSRPASTLSSSSSSSKPTPPHPGTASVSTIPTSLPKTTPSSSVPSGASSSAAAAAAAATASTGAIGSESKKSEALRPSAAPLAPNAAKKGVAPISQTLPAAAAASRKKTGAPKTPRAPLKERKAKKEKKTPAPRKPKKPTAKSAEPKRKRKTAEAGDEKKKKRKKSERSDAKASMATGDENVRPSPLPNVNVGVPPTASAAPSSSSSSSYSFSSAAPPGRPTPGSSSSSSGSNGSSPSHFDHREFWRNFIPRTSPPSYATPLPNPWHQFFTGRSTSASVPRPMTPPVYRVPPFFRPASDSAPVTDAERLAAIQHLVSASPHTPAHTVLCFAAPPTLRQKVTEHYRILARLVHPDKVAGVTRATEAFQALGKARDTLLLQCSG